MQTHSPAPAASTPDLTAHLETLRKALGAKAEGVDEQDLKDELAKYLEYGVPADQAVKTILRHHGIGYTPPGTAKPAPTTQERILLANLPPASPFVNLKVRLLSLQAKTVKARGEDKDLITGLLGDESGTATYSSWRPLEGLAKGDAIEVQGAYTKEFNGQVQVNFGDRTKVSKLEPDAVPRPPVIFQDIPVAQLKEGVRGIRVTARILEVAPRQVTVQGAPKTLFGGSLADPSGRIEFSDWADHRLAAGQVVTIEGGYVRSYRGVAQLSFDEGAKVTPFTGDFPDAQALAARAATLVRDLLARGGGSDVQLRGTLLEVKEGSGLVMRCSAPGCTRVLASGMCRLHNKVEPVPDLRIKAVLDDGTGAVSLIAGREITQALLGKDLEQCKKEAMAAFRPDIIQAELREKLAGRCFAARGNALSDEYGMTFIARSLVPHAEPVAPAAADILAGLGGDA